MKTLDSGASAQEIMKISPQFREHAAMIHHGLERFEKGAAAAGTAIGGTRLRH